MIHLFLWPSRLIHLFFLPHSFAISTIKTQNELFPTICRAVALRVINKIQGQMISIFSGVNGEKVLPNSKTQKQIILELDVGTTAVYELTVKRIEALSLAPNPDYPKIRYLKAN